MTVLDHPYTPPRLPPDERAKLQGIYAAWASLEAALQVLQERIEWATDPRLRFDLQQEHDRLAADVARLRAAFDAMCEQRRAA